MLERKASRILEEWRTSPSHGGLLIMGARQVGKTTLVREFAREHYEAFAEINFFDNKRAIETMASARDADDLFLRISVLGRTEIIPGKTLVFLDEIQECQRVLGTIDALTWLKFLVERTDCDYILSGSLLGLDTFDTRSLPVGFVDTLTLCPLDFEEFCWACEMGKTPLGAVRRAIESREPVPDFLHAELMDLFYRYLLVGGMPAAVQAFVDANDLVRVRKEQRAIARLYRADITKYVQDKVEARQIQMVYESVPGQLDQPNKRFKYTRLGKNLRFANLETSFDWLEHVGVVIPVTKVDEPAFPLMAHEDRSTLKLYMNDVGLLTSQLMGDVDLDILNRRSSVNFGSVFENAVAQGLQSLGYRPHYYQTTKVGEVDFVIQDRRGGVSLLEVKSGKEYRRHSALNNLLSVANYDFEHVFVLYDGNVEITGRVTYLPIYAMGFALDPGGF